MKVVEFQMQLKATNWTLPESISRSSATEIIHLIDPQAPIPCPLEGGNANGPLYQCVLDKEKGEAFLSFCKENPSVVPYTAFYEFELHEDSYNPFSYVHWGYDRQPVVSRNHSD